MKKEWFKDWFETEEYLNVYRHRNEADAKSLISLILSNTNLNKNASVLDMACGAGRHSILFAKEGFKVTAVDLSERLLSVAKDSADTENLTINFIQSDLRNYSTTEKFDLVVNLFTSFGYFESDDENFQILFKGFDLLKDGGYFVFDFFNESYLKDNLIENSSDINGETEITQKRFILNERVEKEIIIKKNGYIEEYFESVRMFTAEEIIEQLIKIGFEIVKTFGDFLGNDFNKNLSPRIIIISKK